MSTADLTPHRAEDRASKRPRPGDRLTERELEVLALVAAGASARLIADRLSIAASTVKSHLSHAYRETGTHNRVKATHYYFEHRAKGG
jgi:DNA-binding CsgD family transcriptional regulator